MDTRQEIFTAFEKETSDWGFDYEKKTNNEGHTYTDYNTGIAFGMFELG